MRQTRESLLPLTIEPGKELNGRFGVYSHDDLVGVPYGSKVASRNGRGYMHLLRPTPELWTLALPHRTQILYMADIAYITSWLALKPGSTVIEAVERRYCAKYLLHARTKAAYARRLIFLIPTMSLVTDHRHSWYG